MQEKPLSRICVCGVCGKTELTDRTLLPYKWLITWEPSETLCDDCVALWQERFSELPPYWITGEGYGEPGVTNTDGWHEPIPEDSTHWGQADFEFV